MITAIAVAGWALALGLLVVLRRRLELVARAEHELRGPVTVLELASRRFGPREAATVEFQLERMRTGLADLAAARRGRRAPARLRPVALEREASGALGGWREALAPSGRRATLDWEAGPSPIRADRGRLAQALGNLVANAAEHGEGAVELRGRRTPGGVRVEVRNEVVARARRLGSRAAGHRGRGLAIAAAAARDAGGRFRFEASDDGAVAVLEFPADRVEPDPPAA